MPIEVGQTYGRLRVIAKTDERRHGQIVWLCECSCGKQTRVVSHSLIRGATRSCGCLVKEKNASQRHDLRGQRFGRLVAREPLPNRRWLCDCDCGNRAIVHMSSLKKAAALGQECSCGCVRVQRVKGMAEGRELGYEALQAMRIDGTIVSAIRADTPNSNSKTGVRGVSPTKGGRYRATITLARRSYHLGTYDTISEAAAARAEAERRMYAPIIDRWEGERE